MKNSPADSATAVQAWMEKVGFSSCHRFCTVEERRNTKISGSLYQSDGLAVAEINISGLSQISLETRVQSLILCISIFGQCSGLIGSRSIQLIPERFAFLALPDEQMTLHMSSPQLSALLLQIPLQSLDNECREHGIDDPDFMSLQDSIPGHERLLLACGRQLIHMNSTPESKAKARLQGHLQASVQSLVASLVTDITTKSSEELGSDDSCEIKHVAKAIAFLERTYQDPVTLTMICQACNVSARTLQTAFQIVNGKTPLQVLHELRLQRLRDLLLEQLDVQTACLRVGLEASGRLAASYKRQFGELPRETRMNARAKHGDTWSQADAEHAS